MTLLTLSDLPDCLVESIFQYFGIFEITSKLIKVNKRFRTCVENYSTLQLQNHYSVEELNTLRNYQREAIYGEFLSSSLRLLQVLAHPRLFLIGGMDDSRRCDVYDLAMGNWRQCGSLSVKREQSFVALQHGNEIYAISGAVDHAVVSIEKFDVYNNYWTTINTCLPVKVNSSAAVSFNDEIWLIGGICRETYLKVNHVHAFTREGNWERREGLNKCRYIHAAATYKGKICVAGGHIIGQTYPSLGSASVEWYDPSIGSWEEGRAMYKERFHFQLVVVSGKLYAIGGDVDGIDTIEYFDDISWKYLTSFPQKRLLASVCAVGSYIFVLGGTNIESQYHSTYDVYCTQKGIWISQIISPSELRQSKHDNNGLLLPSSFELYRRKKGLRGAIAVAFIPSIPSFIWAGNII